MNNINDTTITKEFFNSICSKPNKDISLIIVDHFLNENTVFLDYLQSIFDVDIIISKKDHHQWNKKMN